MRSFNRYAYGNNNPYKYVDPDGMDTVVALKAYPIGNAPIVGKFGHAFVEYKDTETGKTRITRGGPSGEYPGGASGAIMDSSYEGVNLVANDSPASVNVDFNQPGTVTLSSVTVEATMEEVQKSVGAFNKDVNQASIPYQPRGQNSNTYAGNAFEHLTGQEEKNTSEIALPALEKDLDK